MTRKCHPLHGHSLKVLGFLYLKKVLHLLLVLPDGTRSQIPASWTDFHVDVDVSSQIEPPAQTATIGGIADLTRLQMLLDILLKRCDSSVSENQQGKKGNKNAATAVLAKRTGSRSPGKDMESDRLRQSEPTDGTACASDLQSNTTPPKRS